MGRKWHSNLLGEEGGGGGLNKRANNPGGGKGTAKLSLLQHVSQRLEDPFTLLTAAPWGADMSTVQSLWGYLVNILHGAPLLSEAERYA